MLDTPSPRLVLTNTGPAVYRLIEDAIDDLTHITALPTAFVPGDDLPTDADYSYRASVPVISYISAPVYLYDACDTIDKVDTEQLEPVTTAFAWLVGQLADVPREDFPEKALTG